MRQAVTDHTAGTAADVEAQDGPDNRPPGPVGLARVRLLVALGMGTVLVSYALVVPVGALVMLGAGTELSVDAAFVLAAPLWLAAHQVPLVLDGVPLSALPLLPTVAVGALVVIGSATVARRLGGRNPADAGPVVATVAGAHGMVAVLLSAVLPPTGAVAVAPWAALVGGALTAGAAAAIGVLRACGPPPRWTRSPGWLRIGAAGGVAGLAGLTACAAMLVLAGLVTSATQVHDLITAPAEVAGAVGLTALSAGYLPNAVGAATSWLLGPGFSIGSATESVFGVGPSMPLPSVPLLAAMPVDPPPAWAPLAFVLPAIVGVAVGLLCRAAGGLFDRLRAVAMAALVVAAGVAVLAAVSGGRLGAGPFDPVVVPVLAAAAAALGWTALPAAATALGGRVARRPSRPARRAARSR